MAYKHGCFQRSKGIRTRAHMTWEAMKSRCQNPNHKEFRYYGERGITVCERWKDFVNFLEDMGEPPDGHVLDRIDNDLGYFPENCRWATNEESLNNRRTCIYITIDDVTKTVSQWCRETGVSRMTAFTRIKRGWDPKEAVTRLPLKKAGVG